MSDLNRRAAKILVESGVVEVVVDELALEVWYSLNNEQFMPCNRIEHAWMLVEWLVNNGYFVDVRYDTMAWSVTVWENGKQGDVIELSLDDPANAITRAFLEAVGGSE